MAMTVEERRECAKVWTAKWRATHPEDAKASERQSEAKRDVVKRRAAVARRKAADPERYSTANKKWRAENPDRVKASHRKALLLKYDGLGQDGFDLLAEAQGGACASCGVVPDPNRSRGHNILHVDHDHDTKKVRALLCLNCNTAFGLLSDSYEKVQALLTYAAKHKALQ